MAGTRCHLTRVVFTERAEGLGVRQGDVGDGVRRLARVVRHQQRDLDDAADADDR